jgi:hypothetical protein
MFDPRKFFAKFNQAKDLREGDSKDFQEIQQGNLLNKLLSPQIDNSVSNDTNPYQMVDSYEDNEHVFMEMDFEENPNFNASNEIATQIESDMWSEVVSSEITANPITTDELNRKHSMERNAKLKKVATVGGIVGVLYMLFS